MFVYLCLCLKVGTPTSCTVNKFHQLVWVVIKESINQPIEDKQFVPEVFLGYRNSGWLRANRSGCWDHILVFRHQRARQVRDEVQTGSVPKCIPAAGQVESETESLARLAEGYVVVHRWWLIVEVLTRAYHKLPVQKMIFTQQLQIPSCLTTTRSSKAPAKCWQYLLKDELGLSVNLRKKSHRRSNVWRVCFCLFRRVHHQALIIQVGWMIGLCPRGVLVLPQQNFGKGFGATCNYIAVGWWC